MKAELLQYHQDRLQFFQSQYVFYEAADLDYSREKPNRDENKKWLAFHQRAVEFLQSLPEAA